MLKYFKKVVLYGFSFLLLMIVGLLLAVLWYQYQKQLDAYVPENSVLVLNLDQPVTEQKEPVLWGLTSFSPSEEEPMALNNIIQVIQYAEKDPHITGLILTIESPTCGWATLQEIRKALIHFKQTSHKQVIAYGTSYSEKAYFIGSMADRIFLNPNGTVEWKGLSMQVMFYKDLLDKLGVEPIIYRVGEFKSAVEPFSRNSISEPSRLQSQTLLNTVHELVLKDVSQSRKISRDSLVTFANNLRLRNAEEALKTKMITDIGYYEEMTNALKNILKKKKTGVVRFSGTRNLQV